MLPVKVIETGCATRVNAGTHPFTLFISPIGDICRKHQLFFNGYADDSQNYATFKPAIHESRDQCLNRIYQCLGEIRVWMITNLMKLNDGKTEFMLIGTTQELAKVNSITITLGNDVIEPSESVHNLGYYMNNHMDNSTHINNLAKTCYYMLKNISRIRGKIDIKTARILCQELVFSKLDYCNSLFFFKS